VTAHPLLPAFTRRTVALGCVGLTHLAALALLLSLARTRVTPTADETPPLLWMFMAPVRSVPESTHEVPSRILRHRARAAAPAAPSPQPHTLQTPGIDWAEQARSTAIQEMDREEAERRRANALTRPKSDIFSDRAPGPKFGWSHAATHRLEPLAGGGTLINLSDQCVLVFAGLLFMPVCALEKPAARGDLFDHMHDAADSVDPAPSMK
jgi:hypothetical protein